MSPRPPIRANCRAGTGGTTVQVNGVTRDLDVFIQNQFRTETGGAGFADQTSNILGQLQSLYGTPGGTGTLETAFNNFTSALQGLSDQLERLVRADARRLSAAQTLAQQLNVTSQGIQTLRSNVKQDIGDSVTQANTDLKQIAAINTKLQGLSANDPSAATLEDQRDNAINDLSKLMDVNAVTNGANQVSILTNTGIQLVSGTQASQFSFTSAGTLSPTSLYSSNPAKCGVGSLTVKLPNGASIDVVANKVISSGQIAADLQLRDQTLVQAQNQVDQLAATLSSSLSDQTTQGTAVTPSASLSGFTLDLSNCAARQFDQPDLYKQRRPAAAGADRGGDRSERAAATESIRRQSAGDRGQHFRWPRHRVVSIDRVTVERGAWPDPPAILQFIRQYVAGRRQLGRQVTVNSASTTTTVTWLTSGSAQLPLFTDAGSPYTGAITGSGSEMTGLAERIEVNPALLANPADLVGLQHNPPTAGRRHHALEFPVFAADAQPPSPIRPNRPWFDDGAVHRHDRQLSTAVSQPAGNSGVHGDAIAAGPERRRQHVAAKIQFDVPGQHRQRNVEPDLRCRIPMPPMRT